MIDRILGAEAARGLAIRSAVLRTVGLIEEGRGAEDARAVRIAATVNRLLGL